MTKTMRIWSLHPKYLDTKGLVAVWREGLLALHVLSGKTKGYTKHPQLQRFKNHQTPIEALTEYLHYIVDEAETRNYKFDRRKLQPRKMVPSLTVTTGQLDYETRHLLEKLLIRDQEKFAMLKKVSQLAAHPLFVVIEGEIEHWEKTQKRK